MPFNIKIFSDASTKSINDVLSASNSGFFIPIYQRPFKWMDEELSKLFSDAVIGLNDLIKTSAPDLSAIFIGSIITIQTTNKKDLFGNRADETPDNVITIIDGQQRLTSIILMLCVFHEKLLVEYIKLLNDYDKTGEYSKIPPKQKEWIEKRVKKVKEELQKCIFSANEYASGDFKWYPKIIRAKDFWCCKSDKYYISPLSKFIWKYGAESRGIDPFNENNALDWDSLLKNSKKEIKKGYFFNLEDKELFDPKNTIKNALKTIRKLVDAFYQEDKIEDEIVTPSISLIESHLQNIDQLFIKEDENLCENSEIRNIFREGNFEIFCRLTRLLIIIKYFLQRICITQIVTEREDNAFDIFESLNTTGTALTSYETFVPKVVDSVTMADYETSDEKDYLKVIDDYFETIDPKSKKQACDQLIIAFALAYNGTSVGKHIKEQRNFLKNYDGLSKEDKKQYVRSMKCIADFLNNFWDGETNFAILGESTEAREAKLCLHLLNKMKMTTVIAILSRFYNKCLEKNNKDFSEFIKAIKAITAFVVFYRATKDNTGKIDSNLKLITKDLSETVLKEDLTIELLKEKLIYCLAEQCGFKTKETWISKAINIPIYKANKDLTRFILLAAQHLSVESSKDKTLRIRGKEGNIDCLNETAWLNTNKLYTTIEHIAPQNNVNWSNCDIYIKENDYDPYNYIGNLTLLPLSENSAISDASWEVKKICYKFLTTKTQDEADKIKQEIENNKIDNKIETELTQIKESIQKSKHYIHFAETISNYDEWNKKSVSKRGKNLLELAWNNINDWLYC